MDKKILNIKDFKSKAKEGDTENIAVRKQFDIEVKEVDEDNRTIEFVASTAGKDRDMDTINAEGWDLTNYEKNPVMLWAHDYSEPPIGKAVDSFIQNGELRQKFKFVEKEIYPFADMVYQMYKKGYLNAVSVGFDPKEWEWSDDEEGNIDFKSQELLETSAVPVPANPEALQVAGIEGDEELVKSFAKEVNDWSNNILNKSVGDFKIKVDSLIDKRKYEKKIEELQEKIELLEDKLAKSEQSDYILELTDDEDNETKDKINVNADELSNLIKESVQEQIKNKTGKIY